MTRLLCKTDYRRAAAKVRAEAAETRLAVLLSDTMRPLARRAAEELVSAKLAEAVRLEEAAEQLGRF